MYISSFFGRKYFLFSEIEYRHFVLVNILTMFTDKVKS